VARSTRVAGDRDIGDDRPMRSRPVVEALLVVLVSAILATIYMLVSGDTF